MHRTLTLIGLAIFGLVLLVQPPKPWDIYASIGFVFVMWLSLAGIMPSYWRQPNPRFAKTSALWFWGEALWRGVIVRALPVLFIGLALVIMMPAYMMVVGPPNMRADVFWLWFAVFMLTLCAWIGIALLNQPKFLVPPYLRHEPGAIETWREGWRSARENARSD